MYFPFTSLTNFLIFSTDIWEETHSKLQHACWFQILTQLAGVNQG